MILLVADGHMHRIYNFTSFHLSIIIGHQLFGVCVVCNRALYNETCTIWCQTRTSGEWIDGRFGTHIYYYIQQTYFLLYTQTHENIFPRITFQSFIETQIRALDVEKGMWDAGVCVSFCVGRNWQWNQWTTTHLLLLSFVFFSFVFFSVNLPTQEQLETLFTSSPWRHLLRASECSPFYPRSASALMLFLWRLAHSMKFRSQCASSFFYYSLFETKMTTYFHFSSTVVVPPPKVGGSTYAWWNGWEKSGDGGGGKGV